MPTLEDLLMSLRGQTPEGGGAALATAGPDAMLAQLIAETRASRQNRDQVQARADAGMTSKEKTLAAVIGAIAVGTALFGKGQTTRNLSGIASGVLGALPGLTKAGKAKEELKAADKRAVESQDLLQSLAPTLYRESSDQKERADRLAALTEIYGKDAAAVMATGQEPVAMQVKRAAEVEAARMGARTEGQNAERKGLLEQYRKSKDPIEKAAIAKDLGLPTQRSDSGGSAAKEAKQITSVPGELSVALDFPGETDANRRVRFAQARAFAVRQLQVAKIDPKTGATQYSTGSVQQINLLTLRALYQFQTPEGFANGLAQHIASGKMTPEQAMKEMSVFGFGLSGEELKDAAEQMKRRPEVSQKYLQTLVAIARDRANKNPNALALGAFDPALDQYLTDDSVGAEEGE